MSKTLFELRKVSKSYKHLLKTTYALQEVSLTLQERDVYGIIGQSGAGKSTLIRILASLVAPSSGEVLFEGRCLASLDKKGLRSFRQNIGMVFQHFNLLSSRTVYDNIAYPLEIAGLSRKEPQKTIEKLLDLVGLTSRRHHYPSQLSGGEKQRVGIARALANHPKVLLCDEATSALDPRTTKEILSLLKKINQELGVTIVLITHEMDVIKYLCHKVAVLDKGLIIEEGVVSQVFADPKTDMTRHFLQNASHEIPSEFFHDPGRTLLRLKFKGSSAGEPIISEIVKRFDIHANILLGWLDRVQQLTLGTLVISLTGPEGEIKKALAYLQEKAVHYEVLTHE